MKKILLPLLMMFFSCNAIKAQCNANFTSNINQANATFTASSSSNLFHHWNFGDGTVGNGAIASRTYNAPGTYLVKHIVIDSLQQCSDSISQNIVINYTDTVCQVGFNVTRRSTYEYDFASVLYGGSGNILNYTWKVNNQTIISSPNAANFSYTFPSVGSYQVCLTIQTSFGCIKTYYDTINLQVGSCNNLNLSFSYSTVNGNNKTIQFYPNTNIVNPKYSWAFGDGQSVSNIINPIHTYAQGGVYNVSLTATDSVNWCSKTIQQQIYISGAADSCTASFTNNQSNNGIVAFTANSNQVITNQVWQVYYLPDTTQNFTIVGNNPTHQFTQNGSYLVCLTLTTNTGCVKTYCNTINVTSALSLTNNFIPSYPNPTFDNKVKLNVNLQSPEKIKIKVVNVLGNIVISSIYNGITGNNQLTVLMNNLARGQYYIEIIYGENRKYSYFQKL